ncbi:hypothetical protein SUDANB58_05940 (plasmid) [Streptomyces sp. enrichment culture]|uniref:GntR family transcriptional regulator n=1 Tax=Streptomyces sp. enrichment culture TaxID=1795815 RepID=UPI003F567212
MATPRWRQLADRLAAQIADGTYGPGDPLPYIRDLVEQGEGSKALVHQAFRALEAEGLVVSRRGKGTFVRRQRQQVRREPQRRYQWEKDRALLPEEERAKTGATEFDTGLELPELRFHSRYTTIPAPPQIARRFDVADGTLMLCRRYWTSSRDEDAPLSLIYSWLVHEVAAQNPDLLNQDNEPWPGGTMNQLLTIGIEVDHIVDEISTRSPNTEETEILALDSGVPVLILKKTSIDTNGKVAEYSEVALPGDRTQMAYTIPLKRWKKN